MLNFSGVPDKGLLGRVIRLPLRLIPNEAEVRILQGPLRGRRWIAGSSNHGCWLGSYEAVKQSKLIAFVRPGMTCWDVGANAGFYTLLFAELVGPLGKVFAFEPLPTNVRRLQRHVEMNSYHNVRIIASALGDFDGDTGFDLGPSTLMGHLAHDGPLTVRCSRADSLLASGVAEAPDIIKIDIEGAEVAFLKGAPQTMKTLPMVFLATHGPAEHRTSLDLLAQYGYHTTALNGGPAQETDELMAVADRPTKLDTSDLPGA